jgi:hypothetical protein
MKIYSDFRLGEVSLPSNNNQPDPGSKAGSFAKFLEQAVEKNGLATPQMGEVTPNEKASSAQKPLPVMWHQVNGLLDTLERYGQALGDENRSLRQIEPLIHSMERQSQALKTQAGLNTDESLAGLAEETLAQAQVEIIKFRRGDFV